MEGRAGWLRVVLLTVPGGAGEAETQSCPIILSSSSGAQLPFFARLYSNPDLIPSRVVTTLWICSEFIPLAY